MIRRGNRRRLIPVAALLAPVLVVQGFRQVSGWQVQASQAAVVVRPVEQTAPATPTPPPVTDQMRKAAQWLESRGPLKIRRSPMDHVARVRPVAPLTPDPVEPQPAPTSAKRPVNKLVLSAIVGGKNSNMASINGKVFHLGDDVEPGWTIIAIHPRRMVVVLSGPEGQVLELSRTGLDER